MSIGCIATQDVRRQVMHADSATTLNVILLKTMLRIHATQSGPHDS